MAGPFPQDLSLGYPTATPTNRNLGFFPLEGAFRQKILYSCYFFPDGIDRSWQLQIA
jgi:hypothetical protein